MPPLSVKSAALLIAVTVVIYNVLIPGGELALKAIHPEARGESPLLAVMAMGAGLMLIAPRLLLFGIACIKMLQGRNWARILFLALASISVITVLEGFRTAMLIGGINWLLWFLFIGAEGLLYTVGAILLLFSKEANSWFSGGGPTR
jgi:hypothetical protein